ncbi:conserved hypothetical protein [Acidithiobacillus caldus SM-1]|uniref:Uncharacterized protein n=2 Tax=Acidithiobacillus caldus TaxID=33059 RepID=F9ZMD0_ACICS|nr:conserved hypothetical protein [Acidithiobacillus caldus SM-1]AIA54524.1 hypothetical protein Acaty_c0644 [Acidithiobacillus caldus ATCC 51756]QER44830.1 hypothetical protein F0726_01766 [Acidithiobacillus caldus]
MLPRRICLDTDRTLIGKALLTLEKEFSSLTSAEPATGSRIFSHRLPPAEIKRAVF